MLRFGPLKRDLFTISYIIFHHQLFGFHKKEKCLDDYLLSFNVDVCIIPTCTTALIDAKLITQPLLLKLFSCYFRFLFKFAFLFVFKNQRLRWCYKPLPPIILPKISKATFFKVFPCCKSMIAKKQTKAIKISLPSLIIQPLDWFDHFLLLDEMKCPHFWNLKIFGFIEKTWQNIEN